MDEKWIERLIIDGEPEGQRLDFKKVPPSNEEKGIKSFITDLCAFANAQGGTLLYGIEQTSDGRAKAIIGIDENVDDLALRLQTKARNHIYPRITGLAIQPIHTQHGAILAAVVPEQYEGPFQATLSEWQRFPVRTGTRNADMDYRQLGNAFLGRQSMSQRLENWRLARSGVIESQAAAINERIAFLQVLPLSAFASGNRPDLSVLRRSAVTWSNCLMNSRYNIHGLVMTLAEPVISPTFNCLQWHRNGVVDAAWQITMTGSIDGRLQTKKSVDRMSDLLPQISNLMEKSGIFGSLLVSLSLLNVSDHGLYFRAVDGYETSTQKIKQSAIHLEPEFVEEAQSLSDNPMPVVRRLMDQMFQCFGEDNCPHFTRNGDLRN